jgi:glycosyltransferase involved in cell wall biosynthesis
VVALTEGDAAVWRKVNKKVFVIPDAVHLNETGVYTDHHSKSVVFVGRLSRQKDIGSLLAVWQLVRQRYPDRQLHIYGEKGDVEETLWQQLQAGSNGISVHAPTANIWNVYQQHAMLLLTSRYEPFGMVLSEAMSCGLPVVAFDCPYGPSEIISEGKDGFLIDCYDVKAFADKLCLLIENEALRKQMGLYAIQSALRFKKEKIMPQWNALFESFVVKS